MSPPPPPRLCLGRPRRLRAGGDFARLKAEGRRVVQGCLIFNWEPAEAVGLDHSRVGLVAGKGIGNAVIRNRAKRLLREAFRRHQPDLSQPVSAVLVARRSIVGRTYRAVEQDYLTALQRARLLAPAPSAPSAPAS